MMSSTTQENSRLSRENMTLWHNRRNWTGPNYPIGCWLPVALFYFVPVVPTFYFFLRLALDSDEGPELIMASRPALLTGLQCCHVRKLEPFTILGTVFAYGYVMTVLYKLHRTDTRSERYKYLFLLVLVPIEMLFHLAFPSAYVANIVHKDELHDHLERKLVIMKNNTEGIKLFRIAWNDIQNKYSNCKLFADSPDPDMAWETNKTNIYNHKDECFTQIKHGVMDYNERFKIYIAVVVICSLIYGVGPIVWFFAYGYWKARYKQDKSILITVERYVFKDGKLLDSGCNDDNSTMVKPLTLPDDSLIA